MPTGSRSNKAESARFFTQQIPDEPLDVVIVGGGLAGLTLAMQLKQRRPETSILVVEKSSHPVPEAAFKVGESSVEGAAHYLGTMLGLREYLEANQLNKYGFRFFFPAYDNHDLKRRLEVGVFNVGIDQISHPSYQLDRGRLENDLAEMISQMGVIFWDRIKVTEISFSNRLHSVRVLKEGKSVALQTRWVVDASGRTALLKRQLGLAKEVAHNINAAWFRINKRLDINTWSSDEAWLKRVPIPELRILCTNHLMGEGYWVWLIPLASGSTSIGVVADPSCHPLNTINRLELALKWLQRYEPQLAAQISHENIQDFKVLRHYAHGCSQVFSEERWAITGVAGVFTDPFLSPGSELIAVSNTMITDLISRSLVGEDIGKRVETFNRLYLDFLFDMSLREYEGLYPMMGNAHVMTVKVTWNAAWYWGTVATLLFHGKWDDLDFLISVEPQLQRISKLQERMQRFVKEWPHLRQYEYPAGYIDYLHMPAVTRFHVGMGAGLDDTALKKQIAVNVSLIEEIAAEIFRQAPMASVNREFPSSSVSDDIRTQFENVIWSPLSQAEGLPSEMLQV